MGTRKPVPVKSDLLFPFRETGCFYITLTANRNNDVDNLLFSSAIPLAAEKLLMQMGMWDVLTEAKLRGWDMADEILPEFDFCMAKLARKQTDRFRGYVPRYERINQFLTDYRRVLKHCPDAFLHFDIDPLFTQHMLSQSKLHDYPVWSIYTNEYLG